ncbi:hypothetical protein [Flavobacterium hibernum]|uniref:hypothetical protein n=1 Tax=Flavobacterium hibernum TaxID=37752 RepID=UPI0006983839|nr:hypothetical protein [Flavobacterium hibernum]
MKKIILILFILIIISCGEKKTEIIKSNIYSTLFLLKDLPEDDSLVKKMIVNFLLKNPPEVKNKFGHANFYKYTSDTKYFLNNKEDDPTGLSLGEEQLSFYNDEKIAYFVISQCKDDSTKLVGELKFYNQWGNFFKSDTIIYKCK